MRGVLWPDRPSFLSLGPTRNGVNFVKWASHRRSWGTAAGEYLGPPIDSGPLMAMYRWMGPGRGGNPYFASIPNHGFFIQFIDR